MYVYDKRRAVLSFTVLGIVLVAISSQPSLGADVQFTDVTEAAGLANEVYTTDTFHGLGVDWIDYDSDGWPDLFAVNGFGNPAHLYHNNQGNGTFTNVDELLPVLPDVEMAGAVFADYDNDGDMDIYVQATNELLTLFGDNIGDGPPNMLLQNQWVENGGGVLPGQPLFMDVAAAAGVDGVLNEPLGDYPASASFTGGWLDYDRDGWIDLYVGAGVWQSGGQVSNVDTLYHNNGDGTFTDVTAASNVNPGTDPELYRPALAFLGADLNHDNWPDMYVVNMHDPSPFHHDFIFLNNRDGTFTEITSAMPGIGDDSGAGMGIAIADIDLDGDWDIYLTDRFNSTVDALPLGNPLYLGNPDGTWQDNSAPEAGVDDGATSWGVNFLDVDHDGYEDLFVATGLSQHQQLYINNRDGTFTLLAPEDAGIELAANARGSAFADYDRDGDLDLIVITKPSFSGLHLFRNDTTDAGHWLELSLVAVQSNRAAIGALVEVQAGGLNMMRQILGGSSAHSQDELLAHFGVAEATMVDEVRITWPSGVQTVLNDVVSDQRLTIEEPPPETIVAIDGPTLVGAQATVSYTLQVTYDNGVTDDATNDATWTVTVGGEYAEFSAANPGELTTFDISPSLTETIEIRATLDAVHATIDDLQAVLGVNIEETVVDTNPPSIVITGPTTEGSMSTIDQTVTLDGSAEDNVGVAAVVWSTDQGYSGPCAGLGTWTTGPIPLTEGVNLITIAARDGLQNAASVDLSVTYTIPEPPVEPDEPPVDSETPVNPGPTDPPVDPEPPAEEPDDAPPVDPDGGEILNDDPIEDAVSDPAPNTDDDRPIAQPTAGCGFMGLINLPVLLLGLCAIRRWAAP